MNTGIYYIDGHGEKIEIDQLMKSDRKDYVTATRVDNEEPVQLHILEV